LEKAEADTEQTEADVIDFDARSFALCDQVRWILNELRSEKERKDADGNIDEEDPAPGVVIRNPAAERRSDDGRDDDPHAVDGHAHALFFAGKAFNQNGLRDGLEAAAARALQYAKQHKEREAGSQPAKKRADHEYGDAGHIETLAPEQAREPAGQR